MAVIDFNTPPSGPFGSGIFLHADTGAPTQGCVSLTLPDLDAVLRWQNPALHPVTSWGPTPSSGRSEPVGLRPRGPARSTRARPEGICKKYPQGGA